MTRDNNREISAAMNALARSPMGFIPDEAEPFYKHRDGHFDVPLRRSVFDRLRDYYTADKAREWMAMRHPQLDCSPFTPVAPVEKMRFTQSSTDWMPTHTSKTTKARPGSAGTGSLKERCRAAPT